MNVVRPVIEFQPTTIVVKGKPLGRHRLINWSDASTRYVGRAYTSEPKVWWSAKPPLDQGNIGGCTGWATAQCLSSPPFDAELKDADAKDIYSLATELDPFPGQYPPLDTGSTGWAAAMAAVRLGLVTSFRMTVSATDALCALQTGPAILGIDWYQGCDTPSADGCIEPTGDIRGGHEVELCGQDRVTIDDSVIDRVWIRNSWGKWGVTHAGVSGYAWLSRKHFAALIHSGGDCVVFER